MLMDTVCGLGVMCGIMVDMDLTLCNYIPLNQLTTRLNFIYLFIYLYIYCASLGLLLLLISSHKIERCIERGMVNTYNMNMFKTPTTFALLPMPKCMARPLVNGEHKLGATATELPRSVVT